MLDSEIQNLVLLVQEQGKDLRKLQRQLEILIDEKNVLENCTYQMRFVEIPTKLEKMENIAQKVDETLQQVNETLDNHHDRIHALEIKPNLCNLHTQVHQESCNCRSHN